MRRIIMATLMAGALSACATGSWAKPSQHRKDHGVRHAKDQDKDGMPDKWEDAHSLDRSNPADANEDADLDGFDSLTEFVLGTDPQNVDSRPTLADNMDKIVGYWPLSTNAVEAFGSGLNGVVTNGAAFADGSVILDGCNDYIRFGNSPSLSITSNLSCSIWIRPERRHSISRILGKFEKHGSSRDYAVFLCANRIWTFLSDNGTSRHGHTILQATAPRTIAHQEWQHVAVTWQSVSGADGLACFVDGAPIAMKKVVGSGITTINKGSADLTVGAYDIYRKRRRRSEQVCNAFKGNMAQLILCDGTLSGVEVRELNMIGRNGDLLLYLAADFDEDGMPDWWERAYFNSVEPGALDDEDDDQLSNLAEYELGTEPLVSDTDGDGLTDGEEVHSYGTDPTVPDVDVDNDGLIDAWEIQHFGNLDRDGTGDFDGDGLIEYEEHEKGTNPANADSDGDGIPDGWEVNKGLNPLIDDGQEDADFDGLTNAQEFELGLDPFVNTDALEQLEKVRKRILSYWALVSAEKLTFANAPGSFEDLQDIRQALNELSKGMFSVGK